MLLISLYILLPNHQLGVSFLVLQSLQLENIYSPVFDDNSTTGSEYSTTDFFTF